MGTNSKFTVSYFLCNCTGVGQIYNIDIHFNIIFRVSNLKLIFDNLVTIDQSISKCRNNETILKIDFLLIFYKGPALSKTLLRLQETFCTAKQNSKLSKNNQNLFPGYLFISYCTRILP